MGTKYPWYRWCALVLFATLAGCGPKGPVVEDPPTGEPVPGNSENPSADVFPSGIGQPPAGEDPEVTKAFKAKGWGFFKDIHIRTGAPMITLDFPGKLAPDDYALIVKSKTLTTLNLARAEPTDASLAVLSALPTLETLVLMGDGVTNDGVKALAKCPKLRVLHVLMCKDISDQGIAPLGKLASLEELHISRSKMTGDCFAEFAGHQKLRTLHLDDLSGFTDAGAAHLAKIPRLEDLELKPTAYNNQGTLSAAGIRAIAEGNLPRRFVCPPKLVDDPLFVAMIDKGWIPPNSEIDVPKTPADLKVLLLEGYKLGDASFQKLAKFPNVVHVGVEGTDLTDAAFASFKKYPGLHYLRIEKSTVPAEGLAAVSGLPIDHLALEECQLTEDHFKSIGKMTQLKELWLSDSKFDAAWLTHLAGLNKLTELSVRSAALTDDAVAVVAKLPALEKITANGTELGDQGFQLLVAHPKLTNINVDGTKVTKEVYLAAKKKYPQRSFYCYRYDQP